MKVLQHVVLFKCDTIAAETWEALQKQMQLLTKAVGGVVSYSLTAANSPFDGYMDRTKGFNHTLIVTFKDAASLQKYYAHKEMSTFKDLMRPQLKDSVVMDTWVHSFPEFSLFGHTMMSIPGAATVDAGGFVGK